MQVVNHLHVMALEAFALQRAGMTAEFKYLDASYRRPGGPADLKRAWEIVNDIEGPMALIKELHR